MHLFSAVKLLSLDSSHLFIQNLGVLSGEWGAAPAPAPAPAPAAEQLPGAELGVPPPAAAATGWDV